MIKFEHFWLVQNGHLTWDFLQECIIFTIENSFKGSGHGVLPNFVHEKVALNCSIGSNIAEEVQPMFDPVFDELLPNH